MSNDAKKGLAGRPGSALPVGDPIILTRADYDLCLGSGELKPCPFCGDRHPMSFGEKTPNGKAVCWKVQCTRMVRSAPDCCASVWHTDRDQATARVEAVKKWNRRPPTPNAPRSAAGGNQEGVDHA